MPFAGARASHSFRTTERRLTLSATRTDTQITQIGVDDAMTGLEPTSAQIGGSVRLVQVDGRSRKVRDGGRPCRPLAPAGRIPTAMTSAR